MVIMQADAQIVPSLETIRTSSRAGNGDGIWIIENHWFSYNFYKIIWTDLTKKEGKGELNLLLDLLLLSYNII